MVLSVFISMVTLYVVYVENVCQLTRVVSHGTFGRTKLVHGEQCTEPRCLRSRSGTFRTLRARTRSGNVPNGGKLAFLSS